VFGPKCFGGIEAKDLEGEQGAAKIQSVIKHIRNDSTIGQANQILVRWAQMQAGTSKPILEDDQDIPYIENKWIVTLQQFMKQIQASIKEENPCTIPHTRKHDQHIMDAFLKSPAVSEKDYAALNYCRLYLKVTTLSDIVTSDGKRITANALTGYRNISDNIDTMEWPHQEKSDKQTWNKWEKLLLVVHCNYGVSLKKTLGKWTTPSETKWRHRYSHEEKAVYKCTNHTWIKYDIKKSNRRYMVASDYREETTLPTDTTPITDLEELIEGKKFTRPALPQEKEVQEIQTYTSFRQYISTLPKWIQQLIQSTYKSLDGSLPELYELLILNTQLTFVTNGGATDGHTYFGKRKSARKSVSNGVTSHRECRNAITNVIPFTLLQVPQD
jgi:hypothetical protein